MTMPHRPVTVSRTSSTKQRAKSFENQSVVGNGQRVVDAGELRVAFAPDEFGGVERSDNVEKEGSAAFDGLQHEVGHGPDILAGDAAGEVAVVESQAGHQYDDAPERDLGQDVCDAQAGQRGELRECCSGAEYRVYGGQLGRHEAAPRRHGGKLLLASQGGALAAGAGG